MPFFLGQRKILVGDGNASVNLRYKPLANSDRKDLKEWQELEPAQSWGIAKGKRRSSPIEL